MSIRKKRVVITTYEKYYQCDVCKEAISDGGLYERGKGKDAEHFHVKCYNSVDLGKGDCHMVITTTL